MYAMVCTHPDIAHSVGVVSRFLANLSKEYWNVVKWILRYIEGSIDYCLCYRGTNTLLEGFTNFDFVGDMDSGRSTTSYIYSFAGVAVSWVMGCKR